MCYNPLIYRSISAVDLDAAAMQSAYALRIWGVAVLLCIFHLRYGWCFNVS
jgi:hypothetical protein